MNENDMLELQAAARLLANSKEVPAAVRLTLLERLRERLRELTTPHPRPPAPPDDWVQLPDGRWGPPKR